MTPMNIARDIAQTILEGFDKHYRLFREISAGAREIFERADWAAGREAQKSRIQMYDQRVAEAVQAVLGQFPAAEHDDSLWPRIKLEYIELLYNHRQPELAETFYGSVACRVLSREYYNNDYIFWRPATSTEFLEGEEPIYHCYYPSARGLRRVLLETITRFRLRNRFENLRRDIRCLQRALDAHFSRPWQPAANFQLQVLGSLFYRNKAAHIVGRIIDGSKEHPFVVPILQNGRGKIYVDTLLLTPEHIAVFFSFTRAYFMADMEVPSAYVTFLRTLVPNKPKWELYTLLGLQKQGKTMFYRDLFHHLRHSSDKFVVAPGIKGMVMLVFTLPSFPYVFKIIRDFFAPPKDVDRETVKQKYLLVKYHDRVGRMADTLEYSDVALPLDRFSPELLEELKTYAASSIEFESERLVIKHMYIERRMIPLNIYLDGADETRKLHAVREYGEAIRDLAGANIFPGDLLLKNFGVTRHGRVVFYDYDEIDYLTEYNFRPIPEARTLEDEMASEPWYTVGSNDVFPEEFTTFLFTDPRARELFLQYHGDLVHHEFWIEEQKQIRAGIQQDVFPYPESIRFCKSFAAKSEQPPARPPLAAVVS